MAKKPVLYKLRYLEEQLERSRIKSDAIERKIKALIETTGKNYMPIMPFPGSLMVRKRPTVEICEYLGALHQYNEQPYHMFHGFYVADEAMPYYFVIEGGKYLVLEKDE